MKSSKLYICMIFTAFLTLLRMGPASSNPLLNANREDYIQYDNLLASTASQDMNTNITPFSYYKIAPFVNNYNRIGLNLNASETPGFYIKPLNSISVKYINSAEEFSFIEGQSGLALGKGSNIFLFEDAFISLGKNLVTYCQLKQSFTDAENKYDIQRAYGKLLLYKFSIEGGIDNVNLGPGEYGLLLSNNAEPYPLVKIQTEDYLRIFGKWDFLLLHGWLNESREDYDDPRLIAMQISWKPFNFLDLGAARTVLYKGDGRPEIRASEYHKLIAGKKENVPDDKLQCDVLTGYDISLYLPLSDYLKFVRVTKLYFQEAWSSLRASWQIGDDESDKIKPMERAFLPGLFISTNNSILRLEYAATSAVFYSSALYNVEGYSYNGLSLGYPYGRNTQSVLLKYRYYFTDSFSLEAKTGGYQQPLFEIDSITGRTDGDTAANYFKLSDVKGKTQRYYVSLLADARIWNIIIEGFVRVEKTEKYDDNPLPTQYNIIDENKSFYLYGVSASLRL